MIRLLFSRALQMIAIMAAVSIILFVIFDTDRFRRQIAVAELGGLAVSALSEKDYQAWLARKGLDAPVTTRYMRWLAGLSRGDFGHSIEKDRPVRELIAGRLANTAILGACVFALMIPLSLFFGVLAGMRAGSRTDRTVSTLAIVTTSIPEIATAILLSTVLALGLGWLPVKSAMHQGFEPLKLVLPVLTLVIFDFGYVARMTRASMAEVMQSNYIRTATLKGLPFRMVVMRHALRNALLTPFTVIVLQLNWLLSGVVVVEVFFQYDGFGKMLVEAARFGDVYVVQAATLVAVFVAVMSQLISDIGYVLINPRIRFA